MYGTLNGTLYPGAHVVLPFVHQVELYTIRDQILSTAIANPAHGCAVDLPLSSPRRKLRAFSWDSRVLTPCIGSP